MERLHVPGVAVGVLREGEEHVAGFGVTNVDHPIAVDADTVFQIGSTTKTVTGTAIMRLVEAGRLMHLGFVDRDRVMVLDGPLKGSRGEFLRNPDGSIAWLRLSRIRGRQA